MLIDWFTVVAQIVNFLILVWLLKRFLYRPILDAIDARELLIANTLADAEKKQSQAEQKQALFSQKNNDFDLQHSALLESAIEQAEQEKQRLISQAREASETLRSEQQASLARDQKSLHIELGRKTQAEIFAISRQTLRDLADSDIEEQILKVFITRLSELDNDQKKVLSAAISTNSKAIRVRSAFALNGQQKQQLSDAISEQFSNSLKINFDTSPDVISGIELTISGQKLAWSMAHYIDELEKHLQQLVQESPGVDVHNNESRL
jgi:F-type H+-transporting ATPase subunit b